MNYSSVDGDSAWSERRFPVYLVVDCSAAMAGPPMDATRTALQALLSELRGDPQSLECAWVSVITFANEATQIVPLSELLTIELPDLTAGGAPHIGRALDCLDQCLERELRRSTPVRKGDWKPVVVLYSSGESADDVRAAIDRIRARRPTGIVAYLTHPKSSRQLLSTVADAVFDIDQSEWSRARSFFTSISTAVSSGSTPLPDSTIELPPPPPQVWIVP